MDTRVERGQASEDRVTGAIERQTSMVPSSLFLGLALGSMAVSAFLKISGKNHWALFVGQWAAPVIRHNAKRTGKVLAQEVTDPQMWPAAGRGSFSCG